MSCGNKIVSNCFKIVYNIRSYIIFVYFVVFVICHLPKSLHFVPKYSSCELVSLNNY